jgi:hypothetical protein
MASKVKVIYNGPSHFRELGAVDLKKVGVEGFRATSFPRGEEVEVDETVAKGLEELVPGEFTVVKEEPKQQASPAK